MIRLLQWLARGPLRPGSLPGLLVAGSARWLRRPAFWATLVAWPAFALLSWLRLGLLKASGRRPAVLWAPTPILTIAESSALLRRLGYRSRTLVYAAYHTAARFDHDLSGAIANPAVGWWLPNALFLWSLLRFDIYHFFHDGGLWSGMKIVPEARWLELPLLRLAGKRVVASAYGGDVRVRSLSEMWQPYNLCQECPEPGKYCVCDTAAGSDSAKYHRDWCQAVLALGIAHDNLIGSRRDFNYFPVDVREVEFVGATPHPGPVRVVHSPNHRHFKGTRFLEAAVGSLLRKGSEIELDLVEGVPYVEARRRYAEADVVFAQCLAGSPGYTEIEAMATGKPVISYIRGPGYLAHSPGCPIVSATPETLESEMEALVRDPALRKSLGRRGREWVEAYWSYEALAPAYERFHDELWARSGLGRTLRARWVDFMEGEARCRVGQPLLGPQLGEWAARSDPGSALGRYHAGRYGQPPFDESGQARFYHRGRYEEHPGLVARYALHRYHSMLADADEGASRSAFLSSARWLRDRLHRCGSGGERWLHRWDREQAIEGGPWASCSSQGLGLAVLLRAAGLAPGEGFGERAEAAAAFYQVPARDGGLLVEEGDAAYLVDAGVTAPSLQGFATSLLALHEHVRVTGDRRSQALLGRGVEGLRTLVRRQAVDNQGTEAGDEDPYAGPCLLLALYRITGDRFLGATARRWRSAVRRRRLARFLRGRGPL